MKRIIFILLICIIFLGASFASVENQTQELTIHAEKRADNYFYFVVYPYNDTMVENGGSRLDLSQSFESQNPQTAFRWEMGGFITTNFDLTFTITNFYSTESYYSSNRYYYCSTATGVTASLTEDNCDIRTSSYTHNWSAARNATQSSLTSDWDLIYTGPRVVDSRKLWTANGVVNVAIKGFYNANSNSINNQIKSLTYQSDVTIEITTGN